MVDPNTHRYAIDVRLFLATMTTAMVLAFGVGVSFAPPALDAPALFDAWVPVSITEERPEEHVVRTKEFENLREAESPYEPSGQHLLVDINGIDADFLDSEERLAKAMVDAVKAGGLSMLSYHCHKLVPMGVSCVGVLLESHISFHTWPIEGVITLDLFTCGPTPLLSVVSEVERLFAIGENTETFWSHELRGFHLNATKSPEKRHLLEQSDLVFWVLSPLGISKKEIVSTRTRFQKVDIWDTIYPDDTIGHADAIKHNLQPGDPRWLTSELVSPDRMLFLDGTLQSISSSEKVYHEALVHPAMFAHPHPKHIGLIGGGEGGTLREILKHNTVESATMIELDEELVSICREHLPAFSDCKNLKGRADNCFDDELVSVVYQDSKDWFLHHFGPSPAKKADNKFDVLIIDALDPEDEGSISEDLYGNVEFISSLMSSLTEDGILVVQVGTAPTIYDPRADMGVYTSREKMFNLFEENEDVGAMLVYEEDGCGFLEPHSFLVVCKSAKCRGEWNRESDVIEYAIFNRTVKTADGELSMEHFDGSTMQLFRSPPKAWETVYCRREPQPFECAYRALDANREVHDYVFDNEEKGTEEADGSFQVLYDDEDKNAIGVEALKDIPKGSYILPHQMASSFIIEEGSLDNLRHLTQDIPDVKVIEHLIEFIDTHGHGSVSDGIAKTYVEMGVSILIEKSDDRDKINVGRWFPGFGKRPVYSPVYDRQFLSLDLFLVATRDIKEGERLYRPMNLWDFEKEEVS